MKPHASKTGLENRLAAAGNDTDQILLALDIEIALHRADRNFGGNGKAYAVRALSVAMLLLLILGTCGALLYLQGQLGGRRPRPVAAVSAAVPALGTSAPGVAPGRQSGPPKH